MNPLFRRLGTLAALSLATSTAMADGHVNYSALHDYRVVTVAEGLERPWSLAFLPTGELLVTATGLRMAAQPLNRVQRLRPDRRGHALLVPMIPNSE